MKYAADFKSIAREALVGRWTVAVVAGMIAALLGGGAANGPELKLNVSEAGADLALAVGEQTIYSFGGSLHSNVAGFLIGAASYITLVAIVMAVGFFILGSIIEIGYHRFNLDLVDRQKEPQIGALFGYFSYWKTTAAAKFLQALYVFLWSLLLLVPGIMAGYSYAMTGYILCEHPEMTAGEAIEQSKHMMFGNRWRLFCLQLSFIGWDLLCAVTLGIGHLWLTPYKQAAMAAFYRDVSATAYIIDASCETE